MTDPFRAQLTKDWDTWQQAPQKALVTAQARALGIHVDPGRARTHMLVQEVVRSPPCERDVRHIFTIVRAGVFRVRDIPRGIEKLFGLAEGRGEAQIRDALNAADRTTLPSLDGVSKMYHPVVTLSIERRSGCAVIFVGMCAVEKNGWWELMTVTTQHI